MSVIRFWNQIYESGRVSVSAEAGRDTRDLREAIAVIEAEWRWELAFDPPPPLMDAAVWAVLGFYRACQFLVYREIEPATITGEFESACPFTPTPTVCYSVDLAFRMLPDLFALARGLSNDDPLVKGLQTLGQSWPLSSVGMPGIDAIDVSAFIDDRSLARLYADRIIERDDRSRLGEPRVGRLVRDSLLGQPQLAPRLFEAVQEPAPQSK
jgi:hypothetical protein